MASNANAVTQAVVKQPSAGVGAAARFIRAGRIAPLFTVFCLTGCTVLTAPDLTGASGAYVLEMVDGAPLPVAFESAACPREVYRGEMGLAPQIHNQVPLYTIFVELRLRCDPLKVLFPVELREAVRDFGNWTIRSDHVELDSGKGYGEIRARINAADPPAGPVLTLPIAGRLYTFRRTRRQE